jgi:3',5'-cyclic AMP phosphodiesterase CpdA
MSIETMFLVLSDLHFGPDLYEPPEMALLSLSGMLGWVAKDTTVRNAFVKQCAGHDIACVKKLPFYLRFLISEAKNQGFERDTFDLCLLLGDQVTIPDARSYKFLRQYLTQQEYSTSDGYVDYRCSGLGLMGQQILAIPGNHDKLLRTNLDIYDREFNTPIELSERVAPQSCQLAIRKFDHREFVFILVDAGRYAATDLRFDGSSREHLAAGEVTSRLALQIREKLASLMDHGAVDEASLEGSYEAAAKIILVHYPVDYERFKSVGDWQGKVLPHDCAGLPDMIQTIRKEFNLNMVLHGHLHRPMLYNYEGVQVVAATTAAQQGGDRGFHVLKVSDTGQIHAEHHCWNGIAFAADPRDSVSGLITEFPRLTPLKPAA